MLISVADYAARHGLQRRTVSLRCKRGDFRSARLICNRWMIDSEEPYIDHRVKHGAYIGFPRPKKNQEG